MAPYVGASEIDASVQGCGGGFQRGLVDFPVECQCDFKPGAVVFRLALVENAALEVEVGPVISALKTTVHYDSGSEEFRRRRHARVQHYRRDAK